MIKNIIIIIIIIIVEPRYNDICLYDTPVIASDALWSINFSLLTITLNSSVITTQNIQSIS